MGEVPRRSVAAVLLGCVVSLGLAFRYKEKSRWAEDPPPKPPDCPPLPDLDAIRRPDGTVTDVRIIEMRGTKLYVPTRWLTDSMVRRPVPGDIPYTWNANFGRFSPGIDPEECPAVVHRLNEEREPFPLAFHFDRGEPGVPFLFAEGPPQFGVGIGPVLKPVVEGVDPFLQYPEWPHALLGVVPDKIVMIYDWRGGLPVSPAAWSASRETMLSFARWLMTEPRRRDRNPVFRLS